MLKKSLIIYLLMCCFATVTTWAQTGMMSDQQVMLYVQNGLQQGKSQQQLTSELARMGVTPQQAERIKKLYQQNQKSGKGIGSEIISNSRIRTKDGATVGLEGETTLDEFGLNPITSEGIKKPKEYKYVITQELKLGKDTLNLTMDENGNLVSDDIIFYKEESDENQVFGRNIFNSEELTFEPSMNLPTPANYKLGPGDELIIDVWGANQTTIQETITPDGVINVPNLGLVYLSGMTVEQATKHLRKELNKIYAGLEDENPSSQIKVSLGNGRTIQINVMGEVEKPGTYAVSAFSTVFQIGRAHV